ncbi:hypothetical protein, partial [Colwellia echini]
LNLTGSGNTLDLADVNDFNIYTTTNNNNTLQATNTVNTWVVNAENAGTIKLGDDDTTTFSGFRDLVGGSDKDDYTVSANVTSITSGDGADIITVNSGAISSITTGLGNDSVTINTNVADAIASLNLGDNDDTLNIADIASVTNIIEAGSGSDTLNLTGSGNTLDLADVNDFN